MNHAMMLILAATWVACNFYLWSVRQSDAMLFVQSLGMAAVGYPALYWYINRPPAK
jgi:hypothetical protein